MFKFFQLLLKLLDEELQMTIDAKKIIPKFSVPLEDEEWEKFKKK